MDDPWGSPWTTADANDKDLKRPSSPAKSDLEPPPRAFLSASPSPRIPATSDQSPWIDDTDGFGDWGTTSDAPAPAQSGWGGGWVSAPSPNLALPSRDVEFGKASPIAWPGSIALPKPANGSSTRQPSPDPWSTEFFPPTPSKESKDGLSTPRLVLDASHPLGGVGEVPGRSRRGTGPAWRIQEELVAVGNNTKHNDAFMPANHANDTTTAKKEPLYDANNADNVRPSIEPATQNRESHESHESRPSSSSDDDTDHEDGRQDSPITSIDEDSRIRHQVARKTSGKVQELVSKFDGLARAASQEPCPLDRGRSKSPLYLDGNESSVESEAGDFGDFEDADEGVRPEILAAGREATPRVTEARPKSGESAAASPERLHGQPSADSTQPTSRISPVNFDVDLGAMENLFDVNKLNATRRIAGDTPEVSDYIISDSFTEISERKTWYRISRFGSSRMHSAGDIESYRRVAWPASTVRQDTIKVVRRWMEEDSIAGRVTLGGGASKNQKNMFGWDSSVKPIALDAVFGKKKTHSRASSPQPLQTPGTASQSTDAPARKVSGSLRSPTQRPSSMAEEPIASFGWSTTSPASQTPTIPSNLASQTFKPSMASLEPPPTSTKLAANPPTPEDDDEWGDMISSPVHSKPATDGFQTFDDTLSAQPLSQPVVQVVPPKSKQEPDATVDGKALASFPESDPWASVDLSALEPPVKMRLDQAEQPIMPLDLTAPTITHPLPSVSSGAFAISSAPTKLPSVEHIIPSTPVAIPQAIDATESLPGAGNAETQLSVPDGAAWNIIANLPDLSYMLR
ncbi:hypothetical protein B0H63DRAFT_402785 [Podospora didyma]|uniref:Glucan 1, 4-alpha-glucosidase n=1 Tax=Podospora didyma TaxID=330526 RepID=A0AAE0K5L1_9PEZI|nr:hypothetical protein B0H63DRAFT_402785 [Podospora didyma]